MSAPTTLRTGSSGPTTMTEVADRVFAYVQPDGSWCVSNAGVLLDDDGVMLIDTVATERRALRMREAVGRLHAGPAHTVVNTHSHGDHTFGNYVFGPAATVIAHDKARAEMAGSGLALTALWPQVDWGDVRLRLPSVTFQDRLTLHSGDRRIELIHVGPAHTTGDIVAWLPDERVLFAGDVLMSACTPFHLMGSVTNGLHTLATLRDLGPAVVVCGHGPVAGPAAIDAAEDYLRWVVQLAEHGMADGLTPLELARETDLGPFQDLLDPERLVGNLHRAYADLRGAPPGAPLDVVRIFGEMVDFNGGLPTCLA